MKLTHAIVLAAGLGTRMRPLTNDIPKPFIEVAGKKLIDWCLDWLAQAGVQETVVNSSYLAEKLENYIAPRKTPHVILSREEPAPLETGGGIVKALPHLGSGPFLAMNSDAIFPAIGEHPITRLANAWDDDTDFLMLVVPRQRAVGWNGNGDFILDGEKFRRAAAGEEAPYIFTGVEIIHPRVFEGCPQGAFSLNKLWQQRAGEGGWYEHMRVLVHEGDWINVGDLEGLKAAERYFTKA